MEFWKIAKNTGTVCFLLICSIQDLKEKMFSVRMLLFFGILFFGASLLWEDISLKQRLYNTLPGIAALWIAFFTKEQIGYGDGVCLLILGNVIPMEVLLKMVMNGLILLNIYSLVLMIKKKAKRKTTLPFLPFLTAGFLTQIHQLIK